MNNYREKQEAVTREVIESLNSLRATVMRLEADKLEITAKLAKSEADLIVAVAQLSHREEVMFTPDFEIETADDQTG